MNNIIDRLKKEIFTGQWLPVMNEGGIVYHAVALDGLLFHIMTWDNGSDYARVTLCKVQEPSRERADGILQRIIKLFEEQKLIIHKYYHKDKPYSINLLECIDLCGNSNYNFSIFPI